MERSVTVRISVRCRHSIFCGWYGSRVWRSRRLTPHWHDKPCPWCGAPVEKAT